MEALEERGRWGAGNEALETSKWLELVRQHIDAPRAGGEDAFDALRSEAVFRRVMARIEEDRRRGFLAQPTRWLLAMLRIGTALAAGFWNSRTVRLLVH